MTLRQKLSLVLSKNYWYGFVALLLLAAPGQAALLGPDFFNVLVPGAANQQGTVLADVTVPFANGGTAPANLTFGQQLVTLTFRGTNVQVPFYLVNRYLTFPGTTVGPTIGAPSPALTGALRTVVVETPGGTLDFYLQVANESPVESPGDPNDIFRISAEGFNGFGFAFDALDVFYRTDSSAADVLPGVTPTLTGQPGTINQALTADRLASNNFNPAFEFSSTIGGGNSLFGGDLSRFLVIRTSATTFGPSTVTISSTGTAYVSSFAPTPEPGSLALLATGLIGLIGLRRRQRR